MREYSAGKLSAIAMAAFLIAIPSCVWGSPTPVPEIDPSSGAAAVAVLAGAVVVFRAWRKK